MLVSDLIKRRNFQKCYAVDEFLQHEGHDVLRLPPYYCVFNPIEMVWHQVKMAIRKKNVNPKAIDAMNIIREGIDAVTPAQWANYVRKAKENEDNFRVIQHTEDDERFIININDDESSDSDDY